MKQRQEIVFYDRYEETLRKEEIFGESALRWTYETRLGRCLLETAIRRPWFSRLYGIWADCSCSAREVAPFIEQFGLDPSEFLDPPESFRSFNEFFSRRLRPEARPISPAPDALVFPADGRHLFLPEISEESTIYAKGQRLAVAELLGDEELASRFAGGSALLSRLCPTDYHRFHFPLAGRPGKPREIEGSLYSVNPIALARNLGLVGKNRRRITRIEESSVGSCLYLEIGATNVGGIVETHPPGTKADRGGEKGYFHFGGSMVITLYPPGTIEPDEDLLESSRSGIELYARVGDRFGRLRR